MNNLFMNFKKKYKKVFQVKNSNINLIKMILKY